MKYAELSTETCSINWLWDESCVCQFYCEPNETESVSDAPKVNSSRMQRNEPDNLN